MRDYILANVPDELDERLQQAARERGVSPEQAAVELLAEALHVNTEFVYIDLEELELVG